MDRQKRNRVWQTNAMCIHSFGKVRDDFSMKCCPCGAFFSHSIASRIRMAYGSSFARNGSALKCILHSICCVVNLLDDIFHGQLCVKDKCCTLAAILLVTYSSEECTVKQDNVASEGNTNTHTNKYTSKFNSLCFFLIEIQLWSLKSLQICMRVDYCSFRFRWIPKQLINCIHNFYAK